MPLCLTIFHVGGLRIQYGVREAGGRPAGCEEEVHQWFGEGTRLLSLPNALPHERMTRTDGTDRTEIISSFHRQQLAQLDQDLSAEIHCAVACCASSFAPFRLGAGVYALTATYGGLDGKRFEMLAVVFRDDSPVEENANWDPAEVKDQNGQSVHLSTKSICSQGWPTI